MNGSATRSETATVSPQGIGHDRSNHGGVSPWSYYMINGFHQMKHGLVYHYYMVLQYQRCCWMVLIYIYIYIIYHISYIIFIPDLVVFMVFIKWSRIPWCPGCSLVFFLVPRKPRKPSQKILPMARGKRKQSHGENLGEIMGKIDGKIMGKWWYHGI